MLDYGAGNLFSLKCALEKGGAKVEIIEIFKKKQDLDGIILPGVGNFGSAANVLKSYREDLIEAVNTGLPFLGICLGVQMIFELSEEDKGRGLAFFEGNTVKLPLTVKSPHMGWNTLEIVRTNEFLDGIEDGIWVYFVHSYYPKFKDNTVLAATTDYGVKIPAVISKRNIFGTQFHPEKSGSDGLKILINFIDICSR
ncbi:MAG TPA: imidazole glycerol phosphate synthase subunit HisH [Nitrososphaerales archaeon]|nr:imidazole glycerol phosphate synthase subunit HisH [Nitrososphaerales archaeon]